MTVLDLHVVGAAVVNRPCEIGTERVRIVVSLDGEAKRQ